MMEIQLTKTEKLSIDEAPIVNAAADIAADRVSSEEAKWHQTVENMVQSAQVDAGAAKKATEDIAAKLTEHGESVGTLKHEVDEIFKALVDINSNTAKPVIEDVVCDSSVWVTDKPRNTQTGSEANPISVTTADEFKTLLDGQHGSIIYLMDGIYCSYGYCQALGAGHPDQTVLRPQTQIIGVGMPTVHLTPAHDARGRVVCLSNSHEIPYNGLSSIENVYVDLSCDVFGVDSACVYDNIQTEAALLIGPGSKIHNLRFIRPFNNVTEPAECFPVFITDGREQPADNCIISEVSCDTDLTCSGDQQFSLVAIAPLYHPMRNPVICDCRLKVHNSPGGNMHNAFSITGCIGGRVRNCYANGPVNGFYIDSYSLDGLVIEDNEFHDCRAGVVIVNDCNRTLNFGTGKQDMRNIHIRGNHIRLRQSPNWPDSGIVLLGARTPHGAQNTMENVWAYQNTIMMEAGDPTGNWGIIAKYGPQQTLPIPGFRQFDNMVHPKLNNSIIA